MRSVQRVVSDGTLKIVDLSISYFDRSEIAVYINSELYTAWHWASNVEDRIIFNSPIPAGVEVLIKRTTDLSKLRHYFSKGSAFTAEALDEDLQQVLHIAQEATETNLSGNFYNDIDMHGYRVKNIGQAVDDSDALTLRQYKQDAQGAWQARERAVQAEQNAAASATSAAQSAAASQRDSQTAGNAASAAMQYAQQAGMRLEDFERKYLGALDADPTTRPKGIPLEDGMLYFRTTPPRALRVYSSVEGWKNAPEGPRGPVGPQGPVGPANSLSIGSVTTRTDGVATASITGTAPNQILNLGIPHGPQGPQGPKGDKGDPGPAGPPGAGSGDVLGPSSATEGQAAVFDDVTGKRLRAFSGSGMLKSVNGVLQAATAGTDYVTPSGTVQNAQHAVSADSASYATSAGVAASADKLSTPRSINGVPFDGTANITVQDSTKQPLNSNLTSISKLSAAGVANRKSDGSWEVLSKVPSAANADYATSAGSANTANSATKLQTARTITIGNTGKAFDGSANVLWSLDEIGAARVGYLANGVNLNTVVSPGFYRIEGSPINAPSGVSYGQLIVARGGGDTILQIATGPTNGDIYWRQGNPPDVGGPGTWGQWHKFFHSGNLPPKANTSGAHWLEHLWSGDSAGPIDLWGNWGPGIYYVEFGIGTDGTFANVISTQSDITLTLADSSSFSDNTGTAYHKNSAVAFRARKIAARNNSVNRIKNIWRLARTS